MHANRPSHTASVVAAIRALYTEMPEPYRVAPDPLAVELVPGALALPARALAHARWAGPAVHRALGALTLGLNYHVPLRTRAIDDAAREAVRDGATQLVVLGAGLDNRALRMDELAAVRVFEVDHPSTQRYKVERLAALGEPPRPKARELVRVAVDFEQDSLDHCLLRAGFATSERTFWIWEGVTVYLTIEAIEATLAAVAALSPAGSRIALTYGLIPRARLFRLIIPAAERFLRAAGEPLRSPLSADDLGAQLTRAGFRRLSDEATDDWAARYWPGQTGIQPIERLAVAERVAPPV